MIALSDLQTYTSSHQFNSDNLLAVADIDGSTKVNNLDIMALILLIANSVAALPARTQARSLPARTPIAVQRCQVHRGHKSISRWQPPAHRLR